MLRRLRSAIWIGAVLLLITVAIILTPYLTYLKLGFYVAQHRDQTVFIGDNYSQISAVKHSDESNWDMVASEHPPIYWSVKPHNCTFTDKNDEIFSLTGVWIASWACHP